MTPADADFMIRKALPHLSQDERTSLYQAAVTLAPTLGVDAEETALATLIRQVAMFNAPPSASEVPDAAEAESAAINAARQPRRRGTGIS